MKNGSVARIAPWAAFALVIVAAARMATPYFEAPPDAQAPTPASTRAVASQAYRIATVGGIPPAFDFVKSRHFPDIVGWKGATGDFNGDGRDDLLVLGTLKGEDPYYHTRLFTILQLPNGTFADPVEHTVPAELATPWVLGVAAADLDGDGRSDVLITQRRLTAIQIGLMQANGEFSWNTDDWSNLLPIAPVQVADLNEDGKLDLFSQRMRGEDGGLTQTLLSFGDGSGHFPQHASYGIANVHQHTQPPTVLAQMDADGHRDLVSLTSQDNFIFPIVRHADGPAHWAATAVPLLGRWNEAPGAVLALDVNADGRDDVLTVNGLGNKLFLTLYRQQAGGALEVHPLRYPAGGLRATRAADFNGDGRVDFVHDANGMTIERAAYELQDDYGFRQPATLYDGIEEPNGPMDLVVGDFNHDGLQDVVALMSERGLMLARSRLTPYGGAGTLPGAPVALTATAGSFDALNPLGTATLQIGPVSDTGGTAISGYTVFSVPSGVIDADAGKPGALHTLEGVEKHVAYRFYARASNAAGMGPPSNLSNEIVLDGYIDPDAPPTASISVSPPMEGDFGTTVYPVYITLSKPAPVGGASFHLAVAADTAQPGSDYVATPRDITIAAGQTFVRIEDLVSVVGDLVEENLPEYFSIDASNPVNVSFPEPHFSAVIYDDEWPDPRLSVGGATVIEGDSGSQQVSIPIAIGQALNKPISFDLDVTPTGPTEEGVDFAPLHLTGLTLPAGQTQMSVQLTVYGDTLYEDYEGAMVTLSNAVGGTLSEHFFAPITIVDNDPMPVFSVHDVSVIEGDDGKTSAQLVVSLDAPSPFGADFSLLTTAGTAAENRDFPSRYYTGFSIDPGLTEATINIPITGDVKDEDAETFQVHAEGIYGAIPGDTTATITILNDDPPSQVNVSDVSVTEGGLAQFTVSLDKPSGRNIGVDMSSAPGTAQPGIDYAAPAPTHLVFPEDATSFTVNVQTVADSAVEKHESYTVNVANVSNGELGKYQGAGWILNDDLATLTVGNASEAEGQSGTTTLRFPIRLSVAMSTPVRVDVTVVAGTATVGAAGADVQSRTVQDLLIDAGRAQVDFAVAVNGDTTAEANETFQVVVSNVRGALVGQATGTGTIVNDDLSAVQRAFVRGKARLGR